MISYSLEHGAGMFCKTCNQGTIDGEIFLVDGECETCHEAYADSIDTDGLGINVWPDDAVS